MQQNIFGQVDNYLSHLFSLEDAVFKSTEQSIIENGMPEHSVSANQAQFLYLMAKMCNAKRVIEVGSLGGYSAISLARALGDDGTLISIELDPTYAEVARTNIRSAGLGNKIQVITGDAIQVLEELDGRDEKVDLFFMDADKPNYINYFNWALRNARPGSIIMADNVIRAAKILDKSSTDEKVIGVQNYLEMLAKNKQVTTSVLQQVGVKEYDGIAISVVN